MDLFSNTDGQVLATATRPKTTGKWTVTADGQPDSQADTRPEAITALTEQALAVLGPSGAGGKGYSTTVPAGLSDLP